MKCSSPLRPCLGENILDRIGNTPLLRLEKIAREVSPVEIYAKAEWFNPGGSVKDRAAYRMILEGERSGALTPDKIILDSSSGNTGIAYAMIAAVKGYRALIVMPENVSQERYLTIRAYGADVVFSDPLEGSDGAIRLARQIYEEAPHRYFMPDQYNNPANPLAHYETTGPEIWRQTEGRITHFVAGLGTTGTFIGSSRKLKEYNPSIQCIAVQPAEPLHGLEGMKHLPSALVPGIYDPTIPDETLWVPTEAAYELVDRLAKEEGLLVGFSSGAALWGALEVAKRLSRGVVVTVFPDSGTRYLSHHFWS